jgi:hypothetical protein
LKCEIIGTFLSIGPEEIEMIDGPEMDLCLETTDGNGYYTSHWGRNDWVGKETVTLSRHFSNEDFVHFLDEKYTNFKLKCVERKIMTRNLLGFNVSFQTVEKRINVVLQNKTLEVLEKEIYPNYPYFTTLTRVSFFNKDFYVHRSPSSLSLSLLHIQHMSNAASCHLPYFPHFPLLSSFPSLPSPLLFTYPPFHSFSSLSFFSSISFLFSPPFLWFPFFAFLHFLSCFLAGIGGSAATCVSECPLFHEEVKSGFSFLLLVVLGLEKVDFLKFFYYLYLSAFVLSCYSFCECAIWG